MLSMIPPRLSTTAAKEKRKQKFKCLLSMASASDKSNGLQISPAGHSYRTIRHRHHGATLVFKAQAGNSASAVQIPSTFPSLLAAGNPLIKKSNTRYHQERTDWPDPKLTSQTFYWQYVFFFLLSSDQTFSFSSPMFQCA